MQFTEKLNTEIEKIKGNDYSSYQNFYNETSQYLYGVIWEMVPEQDTANTLIQELYTNIYASIAAELSDNSQFYVWAANKAKMLTNTYLSAHGKSDAYAAGGLAAGDALATAATNVGVDAATAGGVGEAGIGAAAGGAGEAGIGAAAANGAGQAGMGAVASGTGEAGIGTVAGTSGFGGASGAGIASAAARTGMSIGAKIAIGVAATAISVGGGIGIYAYANRDKEPATTEVTTEIVATVTDADTEMTTEVAGTTEAEIVDEKTERYKSYYEVVQTYMEEYPTEMRFFLTGYGTVTGFAYAQLVDFNHDGDEQLVVVNNVRYEESTVGFPGETIGEHGRFGTEYVLDIYDYANGKATLQASIPGNYYWSYCDVNGSQTNLCIYTGDGSSPATYSEYEYVDGELLKVHDYYESYDYEFTPSIYKIDGLEVPADTYKESFPVISDYYYSDHGGDLGGVGEYLPITKTLIRKHRTITELASVSGDDAFVNDVSEPEYQSEDGSGDFSTKSNKYNECYSWEMMKSGSFNAGKIIYDEYLNVWLTYEEDVIMIVGGSCYHTQQEDRYFWLSSDDYLDMPDGGMEFWETRAYTQFSFTPFNIYNPDIYEPFQKYIITKEECEARVSELEQ